MMIVSSSTNPAAKAWRMRSAPPITCTCLPLAAAWACMDDIFFDLLRRNVAGLVANFWAAGYVNVITGSFLRRYSDYVSFRQLLPRPSAVFLVDLLVDREVRNRRRITRAKQDHAAVARHGRPDPRRSDNPAGSRC